MEASWQTSRPPRRRRRPRCLRRGRQSTSIDRLGRRPLRRRRPRDPGSSRAPRGEILLSSSGSRHRAPRPRASVCRASRAALRARWPPARSPRRRQRAPSRKDRARRQSRPRCRPKGQRRPRRRSYTPGSSTLHRSMLRRASCPWAGVPAALETGPGDPGSARRRRRRPSRSPIRSAWPPPRRLEHRPAHSTGPHGSSPVP